MNKLLIICIHIMLIAISIYTESVLFISMVCMAAGSYVIVHLTVSTLFTPWDLLKPGDKVVHKHSTELNKPIATILDINSFMCYAIIEHPELGETVVKLKSLRKAEPEELL